mmetsp:Transcript_3550/g.11020  ORF Transcript_3550/g.11020 Transcript_3550/m.11020 type:complete len:309 (-) Transcript_3550:826-1752(-)
MCTWRRAGWPPSRPRCTVCSRSRASVCSSPLRSIPSCRPPCCANRRCSPLSRRPASRPTCIVFWATFRRRAWTASRPSARASTSCWPGCTPSSRSVCATPRSAGPRSSSLARPISSPPPRCSTTGWTRRRRDVTTCHPKRSRGWRCARCSARWCTAVASTTRSTSACWTASCSSCSRRAASMSVSAWWRETSRSCACPTMPSAARISCAGWPRCPTPAHRPGWACPMTPSWCYWRTRAAASSAICFVCRIWTMVTTTMMTVPLHSQHRRPMPTSTLTLLAQRLPLVCPHGCVLFDLSSLTGRRSCPRI